MRCETCRSMISESLDERRELAPAARDHAESCPECRSFRDAADDLERRLRAAADLAPAPAEARRRTPVLRFWRWAATIAAAACLVVGVSLWLSRGEAPEPPGDRPAPGSEVAGPPQPSAPAAPRSTIDTTGMAVARVATQPVRRELELLRADAAAAAEAVLECVELFPAPEPARRDG